MENENNISVDLGGLNLEDNENVIKVDRKNFSTVFEDIKQGFKKLKKGTKIAITVTAAGVLLSIFFAVGYGMNNRYDILFSDLDSIDANTITQMLEEQGVDMKVEGDSIYVKSKEVDELRLKLSSNITNGSVGFEIMDNSSGFGMTEDEFQIKKQRVMQGEIERTIRTFPQVNDVRVHITPGEESIFAKDNKEGSAAVYLTLRAGQSLKPSQVMSIVSLVSASSTNVPKQNVEVIDQNMTLLSEGMFDDEGNYLETTSKNSSGLEAAREAERRFNDDIEKSLAKILEPLFGVGKVKIAVNADLNFDSAEKTEIVFDPNNVIKNQTISENSSTDKTQSGSPVDNNMSNTVQSNGEATSSKESSTEYEVGKTETNTVIAPGEINRITASIALDGVTDPNVLADVQELVETAIGLDANRGDKVTVMSAEFGPSLEELMKEEEAARKKEQLKTILTLGGGTAGVIALALILIAANKKKKREREMEDEFEDLDDVLLAEDIINQAISDASNSDAERALDGDVNTYPLEEEIRNFASQNPEQMTELIKIWLNE